MIAKLVAAETRGTVSMVRRHSIRRFRYLDEELGSQAR